MVADYAPGRRRRKSMLQRFRRGKPKRSVKSWAASASNRWPCHLWCGSGITVPIPDWAQRISIAAAEQFERSALDRRFSASRHARAFLEERLQQLKIKLQDSEKQLIEYAQQRGIVNVDDKQPEAVANLQAIQNALSAAVTERLKREQLWLLAQSSNSLALPQATSDRLIQAARDRIGALQASYQEKLSVLKPAFPEMVALRAQITESAKANPNADGAYQADDQSRIRGRARSGIGFDREARGG